MPDVIIRPTTTQVVVEAGDSARRAIIAADRAEVAAGIAVASATPDYPGDDIAVWGDSLSSVDLGGDWAGKLATLRGISVYNGGVSGQGSRQIAARQGGTPARVTGFTIPTGTGTTAITINGVTPLDASTSMTVLIDGIEGTLARDSGSGHTFARSASGSAVVVPYGTEIIPQVVGAYRDRIQIICTGRNSFRAGTGDPLSNNQILSLIRSMVDFQFARVKRTILWGIVPADSETTGTGTRNLLNALNTAQAAAFPELWLDIPAWLRTTGPADVGGLTVDDPFTAAGISPTSQDLTDISNSVTPTSFRQDVLHFNNDGGKAIAYRMSVELQLRGWV